ncbi:MAG: UDP-N-acetylmuramate dehydrogenase [Clostridia bacterium]|nr:UDP-N-acetylmuramate dehydrogenase [Clostridia bacterium]
MSFSGGCCIIKKKRCICGILDPQEASFSSLCTIRTGGLATRVFYPTTVEQCAFLYAFFRNQNPILLGNGSNVLFLDENFSRPIIKTTKLKTIRINKATVYAEAGVPLPVLSRFCLENGLSGAEFLCGIPGTVGGGVVMNAGAYGKTLSDHLISVQTNHGLFLQKECGFSYRKSCFQTDELCVLGATFRFIPARKQDVFAKMQAYTQKRKKAQPAQPSAGSVFAAYKGVPAWKIIDSLQLRGMRVGGAEISQKHANFIVNTGNATSKDVLVLISQIKTCAKKQLGVQLRNEIVIIGEDL